MERAQTQSDGGVTVTTAVLSDKESREAFSVDLAGNGIQPVWLKIENRDDVAYWLFPISIDPRYYSPLEVAWRTSSGFSAAAVKHIQDYLCRQQMPIYLPPGTVHSGFIFTNVNEGSKQVVVELVAPARSKSFVFYATVPGIRPAFRKVDVQALYPKDRIVSYDEKGLRTALEGMPCCTKNKASTQDGDFLNIVIIGEDEDIWHAFVARQWDDAEQLTARSAWRSFESFFFGSTYLYAPMSALYSYGRSQDRCYEKARRTIDDRTHLRLWLTPMRFDDKPVWIGAITRDIGIFSTLKAPPLLLTHKIDSDVDETRDYLVQDLLSSHRVARIGFVKGVGESTPPKPRENLTGDQMFTDGLRAVFVMTSKHTPLPEVKRFDWERPASPLLAPER